MEIVERADRALEGRVVAIPESRQLDILANLLSRRGASVLRIPLVSILDAPDPEPVNNWLQDFTAVPGRYLVILTGEGIRRLTGFAERAGCLASFTHALGQVTKICRGPKPARALRELGLKADVTAAFPTTQGIIESLDELQLENVPVDVQLYGEDPNTRLTTYLHGRGAQIRTVAPYVYASHSDEDKVVAFIHSLKNREVDVVAFTSQPQYHRLLKVAQNNHLVEVLHTGLRKVMVAAIGPVVADQLREQGIEVKIMPKDSFHMKPMVTEIVRCVGSAR